MDFPVCPACHQSVIDDDAVDCPFCGASMKGKPTPKPSSKPQSGSSPSATSPKPPSPPKNPFPPKSKASKPTLPGDDFPFDVELTVGKSAIPALPSASKLRAWKVICPMCDTPGYLPATAAGQEVRCANPKCVMPVFTAPLPEKKEAPPPPPPPKPSKLPYIIGTLLIVSLLAGGGYYVLFMMPTGPKVMSDADRELLIVPKNKPVGPPVKKPAADGKKDAGAESDSNEIDTEELRNEILKQMKSSSLSTQKQRSKQYCKQLSAEANAVTGHLKEAREHLDQLLKLGNATSYFVIVPLLDIFWYELAVEENQKAAFATLNTASKEVPNISTSSSDRVEIASRLAAALVAADRIADATTLLTEIHSAKADAQLAARLQIAMDGRVSLLRDDCYVLPWKFPQAVATTASLLNRGHEDLAVKWMAVQTDDEAKCECLAYWAEESARKGPADGKVDPEGTIAAGIKGLPPVLAARVWARAGYGRFLAKDTPAVAQALELAKSQLAEVGAPPAAPTIPPTKPNFKYHPPANVPLFLQAATAAGEIAFVQAQSRATIHDAEKSLDLALAFVDATAPSLAAANERLDEFKQNGELSGLRKRFKDQNTRMKDDDARMEALKFKTGLMRIVDESKQRFNTAKELLRRLRGAGVGLNSKVWIIVNSRMNATDDTQENFFTNGLPGELIEGLKGTPEANAIKGAWKALHNEPEPPRPVAAEFRERLGKDPVDAAKFLQASKSDERQELFLEAAGRLAAENKLATAFSLITAIKSEASIREECLRLAAAIAAQNGHAEDAWKEVAELQEQTEKISVCRGVIAGLQFKK